MRLDVRSDFPTGNGIVVHQADGAVLLDRDLRDSDGDRWYWRVRLRSRHATTVRVILARPYLLGRFGPWVQDGSRSAWLSPAPVQDSHFELRIEAGRTADVCATVPYGPDQLTTFMDQTSNVLRWTPLTTSEAGRTVPLALLGDGSRSEQTFVLTARHHACEAVSSYVLEGAAYELLRARCAGDAKALATELIAVPAVDIDGVCRGDQGKARQPWDHNRDYQQLPRYRAVAAMQRLAEKGDRPLYALDLHTPGLRGDIEEKPYVVASGGDDLPSARALLDSASVTGAELLIFDQEWNTPASAGERCCAAWLRSLRRTKVALTIEYPNAADRGWPVTPTAARRFGAALLRSLLCLVA